MIGSYVIPDRFRKALSLHIIKNRWPGSFGRVPLILGIHGPTGEGKTFQCEKLLEELHINSFLVSGGQLESGIAGEPAKLVRSKYLSAGKSQRTGECWAAALLINDIDTGIGNWGENVQTTINTQTVYGELMHMVDYPTQVEGVETERIPLIITGNDFTKLYAPLVRAGRMTSFEWKPDLEERIQIISRIFPEDFSR